MTHALPYTQQNFPSKSGKLEVSALKDLSRKRIFPWLSDALADWAVMIAAGAILALWPNPLTLLAAILVIGNRQHALAVLGHDGTHYTLSKNRTLNDLLTNFFCFWPLGLTVSGYRALHYTHHAHTGTENDPELGHKRMRAPQWDLPASRWKILGYAARDLIGYSLHDYIIIVTFSKPARKTEYIPLVLFHLAGAAILVTAGLWWAAALWYACLVTGFMMFFRLRLWLEHQGTGDTLRVELNAAEAAILAPHNAWHHWEHHKYPTVPYYNLPKVRQATAGHKAAGLGELLRGFESAAPVASGTPLKNAQGA